MKKISMILTLLFSLTNVMYGNPAQITDSKKNPDGSTDYINLGGYGGGNYIKSPMESYVYGHGNVSDSSAAILIGDNNFNNYAQSVGIGGETSVLEQGSVALGFGSVAGDMEEYTLEKQDLFTKMAKGKAKNEDYAKLEKPATRYQRIAYRRSGYDISTGTQIWNDNDIRYKAQSEVSVGVEKDYKKRNYQFNSLYINEKNVDKKAFTRQITNVGAGSKDTDAVNLAQLKDLKSYIDNISVFEMQDKNGNKVVKGKDGKFYRAKDIKGSLYYNNKYYVTGLKEVSKDEIVNKAIVRTEYDDKIDAIKASIQTNDTKLTGISEDISKIKDNVKIVDKKSDLALSGVSNAVAMANLPNVSGDRKFNFAASYGYYGGSHAVAIGFSGINDKQNFTYKLSGAVNSKGNLAFGVGAGFMLGSVNNRLQEENMKLKSDVENLKNQVKELYKLLKR
ncbi:YadA-like family protein [uncultured Sneathia sp.]|uniref:YadA family autotransporter adhesin n=1 Tax=uncultured Sneathia sp. TaxID=278067 RepID=UPI002593B10F|nr:YadA-like family protein [uncultured Sneathia sp.]